MRALSPWLASAISSLASVQRIGALAALLGIFLGGCGYRPIADYASEVFGKSVYVELGVNLESPESSVIVKDTVNKAILSRFLLSLAPKDKADSILRVDVAEIKDESVATSQSGFTSFYDLTVTLRFSFKQRSGKMHHYTGSATVSYSVAKSPLDTDKNRTHAINRAALQVIDAFVSYMSYQR